MNLKTKFTNKRAGIQGGLLLMGALVIGSTVAWKKPFKDQFHSKPYRKEVYQNLPEDDKHDPKYAVAGLKTAEGLETTLFAAEPTLVNPTNIDVDAKGRVWVCEAYNYRTKLNPKNQVKPEGDRILILEDTNGDGQADNTKVYYQGTDINAALGVWVMGNKVIVSCSPNIFIFTDTNGDDKPDNKEVFFTGMGGEQHDHAVHAMVFGPDGKLYFNFGNAGDQIQDGKGNPVKDRAGNEVNAKGKPYRQGMVFRCNPDGSEFEVLGHNFRNNYEVAVDSYGTLWQSDNDDDGNKGVRINYVMEFGNYGYHDEMTGAAWQASRTNMETEIPKKHWHLNDPGVVPNLLQTGAGSPTGMIVYEGRLLPKVYWDQMIHSDAGPNVVRSYPVTKNGAGYEATIVNVLEGRDQWFRPSDVCVAPDGSLIISDWYDPGVGGHQAGDQERGRIFRVAPPQTPYKVPAMDLSTAAGAIEALKSPNLSTRYLAWEKLHGMGKKAEKELLKLWVSDNDRFRARALWLLAKIPGREKKYIDIALKDINPDIRITGLRIARQTKMDIIPYIKQLSKDLDPQVRREVLIALRHNTSPDAPAIWTDLATKYDGKDRWYLEALGIAADKQWDKFFADWWKKTGESGLKNQANRDIVWRSRSKEAIPLLASLASDPATSPAERPRYFRAFDFQEDASKQDVLLSMLKGNNPSQAQINLLALRHIDPAKVESSPEVKTELGKALVTVEGTQEYLDLVSRFGLKEQNPNLLKMAVDKSNSGNLGVDAARLLLRQGGASLIGETFNSPDEKTITSLLTALGRINSKESMDFIESIVMDSKRPLALRKEAVQALGRGWSGEERLLGVVKRGNFPAELKPAAASTLMSAYRKDIREGAAQVLDIQAAASNSKKLPPLNQLIAMKGDITTGKTVFTRTCSTCHQVNGEGIDFGPKLSEIGSKLSKEAQYFSILQPDAGISFGYEGYVLKLKDGSSITGIIASQTEDEVDIRMPGGTGNRLSRKDIVSIQKMETSLMPSGLHQTMSEQELVDLVEYLASLKKSS